jgi:hypothetical protein
MRDRGKILVGLAVFVILVTFPFWSRLAAAGDSEVGAPELEYPDPSKATACVEDSAWMTTNHMHLLNDWRNAVVREGAVEYTASNGKIYTMSLTKTCLDCHGDPDNFCTRCHDYADVTPTCWECHTKVGGGS